MFLDCGSQLQLQPQYCCCSCLHNCIVITIVTASAIFCNCNTTQPQFKQHNNNHALSHCRGKLNQHKSKNWTQPIYRSNSTQHKMMMLIYIYMYIYWYRYTYSYTYIQNNTHNTNQKAGFSNLTVTQQADLQGNQIRIQVMRVETRWRRRYCNHLHRFSSGIRRRSRGQCRRMRREHAVHCIGRRLLLLPGAEHEVVDDMEDASPEHHHTLLNPSPERRVPNFPAKLWHAYVFLLITLLFFFLLFFPLFFLVFLFWIFRRK